MRRAVDKRQSMRLSVRLLGASTPHLESGGRVVPGEVTPLDFGGFPGFQSGKAPGFTSQTRAESWLLGFDALAACGASFVCSPQHPVSGTVAGPLKVRLGK